MDNELMKLYNTLMLIETKGESTKLMAQCLTFVQALRNQVVADCSARTEEEGTNE